MATSLAGFRKGLDQFMKIRGLMTVCFDGSIIALKATCWETCGLPCAAGWALWGDVSTRWDKGPVWQDTAYIHIVLPGNKVIGLCLLPVLGNTLPEKCFCVKLATTLTQDKALLKTSQLHFNNRYLSKTTLKFIAHFMTFYKNKIEMGVLSLDVLNLSSFFLGK